MGRKEPPSLNQGLQVATAFFSPPFPPDAGSRCQCNPYGSVSSRCDASGRCQCKVRWRGGRVETPKGRGRAHWGFPTPSSQAHSAEPAGPLSLSPSGLGLPPSRFTDVLQAAAPCSPPPPCRAPAFLPPAAAFASPQGHVEGLSCDSCRPHHFHLSAENPAGCLPCFCMGVTQQCTSSSHYRDMVRGRAELPSWGEARGPGSRHGLSEPALLSLAGHQLLPPRRLPGLCARQPAAQRPPPDRLCGGDVP